MCYVPLSPPVFSQWQTQARSLAARLRREAVTTSVPAIAIQAAARRCLARKLRRRLATERQIEWEWKTMAKELARFCAERARLRYFHMVEESHAMCRSWLYLVPGIAIFTAPPMYCNEVVKDGALCPTKYIPWSSCE